MLSKQELVKTKEYWIATLSMEIWNAFGSIEENVDKCDAIATEIVDDEFMKRINSVSEPDALLPEITQIPEQPQPYNP